MQKIMFNDKYGLTQAVLEGRKTQTRRFIPNEFFSLQWDERGDTLVCENEWGDFIDIKDTKFCRIKNGEVVAIAQSYKDCGNMPDYKFDEDGYPIMPKRSGFFNKMFVKPELMPHQIRITKVRIERLQDISDEDCLAEGISKCDDEDCNNRCYLMSKCDYCHCGNAKDTPREAYAALIDKVGKKGDWASNPYVFVYEFELVK